MTILKIRMKKTLNAINETAGAVNAAQFTYEIANKAIRFFHKGKHHHSVDLSDEEERHLANGGSIECEYACGTALRVKK